MKTKFSKLHSIVSMVILLISPSVFSEEVTVAGFAFAGDFKTASVRFPYAFRAYEAIKAKAPGDKNLSMTVIDRAKLVSNPAITFQTSGDLVRLKGNMQPLMVVLLLSGETVSTEKYGTYYKTYVNLRGDALIFDYKKQTVVRSYPVSVVLFDAAPEQPSAEKLQGFVSNLITREDKEGLISQFAARLANAALPAPGTKSIQVRKIEVAPEVLALMPESLRQNPKAVESMLADSFGAILSDKMGVPMLPNSLGHAVKGEMAMHLENIDDYILKLDEGDYLFDLKLNKLAKIKTAETNVKTTYVFGVYANVRFYEPLLGTDYINSDFKNGETAEVPAGQIAGDDLAAYQDAIRGLFKKLADALNQPGSKWVATAASSKDILGQVNTARDILVKCK